MEKKTSTPGAGGTLNLSVAAGPRDWMEFIPAALRGKRTEPFWMPLYFDSVPLGGQYQSQPIAAGSDANLLIVGATASSAIHGGAIDANPARLLANILVPPNDRAYAAAVRLSHLAGQGQDVTPWHLPVFIGANLTGRFQVANLEATGVRDVWVTLHAVKIIP